MAMSDFASINNVLSRADGHTIRDINAPTNKVFDAISENLADSENLSENHFNTILKCRWCGGTVKEVFIEKLKDGKNGKPYEITYNYSPCDECQAKWRECVVVIEITDKEPHPDCLPIYEEIYPMAEFDLCDYSDMEGYENMPKYINAETDPEEYAAKVYDEAPRSKYDPDWDVELLGDPITQFGRNVYYPTGRYVGVDSNAASKLIGCASSAPGRVIYQMTDDFDADFGKYFR